MYGAEKILYSCPDSFKTFTGKCGEETQITSVYPDLSGNDRHLLGPLVFGKLVALGDHEDGRNAVGP